MTRVRNVLILNIGRRNFSFSNVLKNAVSKQKYCAIIGSGPAGFYTAQGIFKTDNVNSHVHIFEKLPVPFGLVRYGVAPDHPDVKNVINKFTKTASHKNFRFFGNVQMGRDLTIADLRKAYDAVVLCYGADSEKRLNVPGEDAVGVYSARSFVGWYNGLPNFARLSPKLTSFSAFVIGHGNVAVDVARILLSSPSELAKTDITCESIDALRNSAVKNVFLVGRRGPLQASFTTGELRELLNLSNVRVIFNPSHFERIKGQIDKIPRPKRRLAELMLKHMSKSSADKSDMSSDEKCLHIEFYKSPKEISFTTDADSTTKVATGITFSTTTHKNPDDILSPSSSVSIIPGNEVTYDTGLVIKSLGYHGVSIDPSLPFDPKSGTIASNNGRVQGMPGVYCSGWISRGAVGVIADTMINATQVGKMIANDLATDTQKVDSHEKTEFRELLMSRLTKAAPKIVDWPGWMRIDASEKKLAEQLMGQHKPREKITAVDKMIEIANNDAGQKQ